MLAYKSYNIFYVRAAYRPCRRRAGSHCYCRRRLCSCRGVFRGRTCCSTPYCRLYSNLRRLCVGFMIWNDGNIGKFGLLSVDGTQSAALGNSTTSKLPSLSRRYLLTVINPSSCTYIRWGNRILHAGWTKST